MQRRFIVFLPGFAPARAVRTRSANAANTGKKKEMSVCLSVMPADGIGAALLNRTSAHPAGSSRTKQKSVNQEYIALAKL